MSDTLDLVDGVYDADTPWRGMFQQELESLTAANFPVKPPSTWFEDPGLKDLTPLTILSTGQVYGHIAAWHTSHIGLAGGVRPPRSKSGYAYFRTGVVETDDGAMVDVGQITLAGGHASLEASVREAVAHYDDTNSAIMDVAAGEDRHGIWVAGALRPSVTEEQVRAIRASSVSGDWRPINGKLELVAVCAVNCPGFPIPRARVAAGAPIAMVAAGVEPLIERTLQMRAEADIEAGIRAGLHSFRKRIAHLESVVLANGAPLATAEAEELRRRVHGDAPTDGELNEADEAEVEASIEAQFAELRARVHGVELAAVPDPEAEAEPEPEVEVEGEPVEAAPVEAAVEEAPLAAALRARVHGTA